MLDSVQGTIDIGNVKLNPGPPPTLALTATVRDTLQEIPAGDVSEVGSRQECGSTSREHEFVHCDAETDRKEVMESASLAAKPCSCPR